jgi:hypothetical protein
VQSTGNNISRWREQRTIQELYRGCEVTNSGDKKVRKLFLCLINEALRHEGVGGVDERLHIFLTSALVGGEWSTSDPCRFTPGTHWIGSWVDPRAGLDNLERRKFLPPPGLNSDPSVVQPVVSAYTDCAVRSILRNGGRI